MNNSYLLNLRVKKKDEIMGFFPGRSCADKKMVCVLEILLRVREINLVNRLYQLENQV